MSVDDEVSILLTRQRILESEGYKVLNAASGEEALRIFAVHPVDLVLLDYVMPGVDGGMVAKAIKQHTVGVPIIMVSASPVPPETAHVADCFITKGQGPMLLLQTIRDCLAAVPDRHSVESTGLPSAPRTGFMNGS